MVLRLFRLRGVMDLNGIVAAAKAAVEQAESPQQLDQVRVDYMGKKGHLTEQLKSLGKLSAEERPAAGQAINQAKQEVQQAINAKNDALKQAELAEKLAAEQVDVTLPGRTVMTGGLHPV